MTKNEAMQAIATLSSGTIATIIHSDKYSVIDDTVSKWILAIASAPEDAFKQCETWRGVLDIIKERATIERYYNGFMKFSHEYLVNLAGYDDDTYFDTTGMTKEDIAMTLACDKYNSEDHYMK